MASLEELAVAYSTAIAAYEDADAKAKDAREYESMTRQRVDDARLAVDEARNALLKFLAPQSQQQPMPTDRDLELSLHTAWGD
jgi:hypothetical protein